MNGNQLTNTLLVIAALASIGNLIKTESLESALIRSNTALESLQVRVDKLGSQLGEPRGRGQSNTVTSELRSLKKAITEDCRVDNDHIEKLSRDLNYIDSNISYLMTICSM